MVQSKPLSVTLSATDAWVDHAALRPTNLVPFLIDTQHNTPHANVVLIKADVSYVITGANRLRDNLQQILIIVSINRA